MQLFSILACLTAVVLASPADKTSSKLPRVDVPRCPRTEKISYSQTIPDKKPFPRTAVELCWDKSTLHLAFSAFEEKHFHFNASQGTNDDIWEYSVMEAFIHHGTNDPQTYLEFEVNPNNVTYQAFIYNPSKVRAPDAPFDHFFVSDPLTDGITATTKLNRRRQTWVSKVQIPLGLFNVDEPRGTRWRMNFFRTITSPSTFPDQELGGWSSPDEASFHKTPFFGHVRFV
ncbi:hypothetical protein AJ80_08535 [Polytolypa hystricis UAMH7299]|uniref:Carbohydrate-binding domain-containing protein n=1 Tax=Polytolypa hystricis (strain UAMH7299) TaxID=1447883 RepID=A0A2B7X6E1_POLH7|nr:hypothetical protein AJ80_08535 [Polytolypa hystricis UAMH7299]